MNTNDSSFVRRTFLDSNKLGSFHEPASERRRISSAIIGLAVTISVVVTPSPGATAEFGMMVNPDGAFPAAGLVLSSNTLYGTAQAGGGWGHGEVFSINTDGSRFMSIHSFMGSDGMNPYASLVSWSNTLNGTANCGTATGSGTVFEVDTEGTNFMTLHTFAATSGYALTNSEGADPYAGLTLSGNTLYGTTEEAGEAGGGSVFAVSTDGMQFDNLHSFTATTSNGTTMTNGDGFAPQAGLLLSDSHLYGTAMSGGSGGAGTIFVVDTNGGGFATLHSFVESSTNSAGVYTNSEGANPAAKLVLSGNTLYGTAQNGGRSGNGTIFAINTDGTGFRVLHTFSELMNHTNSDGATPHAGLVLSSNTLYGAAEYGGSSGNGMIFSINTDGSGFKKLYNFTFLYPPGTNSDGTYPYGTLVLSDTKLYGTGLFGGDSGNGTVFVLNTDGTGFRTLHSFTNLSMIVPQLTITSSGPDLLLSWPIDTGSIMYSVESTTDLSATAWDPVSFTADSSSGLNMVTLPAGAAQFFRLKPLTGGCTLNSDCPIGSTCVRGVCMVITGGGGGGFGFGFGFGFGGFGFGGFGFGGFGGICSGCGG